MSGNEARGNWEELLQYQMEHPIWKCPLLAACRTGLLTRDDFSVVFSQYYRYSKDFTRYLAALMSNCDSDYYRSRLAENLWDEGGGADPEKRHAALFRSFLRDGLGIDVASIVFQRFADCFSREYLAYCQGASPLAVSAFLSVGTEAIVPRLYGEFCEGLLRAGIGEPHLAFFRLHMECDDEHAATLAELMRSYSSEPSWFRQCQQAVEHALTLRQHFFEDVMEFVLQQRLAVLLERMREQRSLLSRGATPQELVFKASDYNSALSRLYANIVEDLNIDFSVHRVTIPSEVFDVRFVSIAPHRYNEYHRHAHESLLTVVRGGGRLLVGEHAIDVTVGDTVFVPRWTMHQTQNTGDEPMELLAVTDYGLTHRATLRDHLCHTRMNPADDADAIVLHAARAV